MLLISRRGTSGSVKIESSDVAPDRHANAALWLCGAARSEQSFFALRYAYTQVQKKTPG
jgi:hypothetical protein